MRLCGFEVDLDRPMFLIAGRAPGLGGAARRGGQGALGPAPRRLA
jgi:hypothetical protein